MKTINTLRKDDKTISPIDFVNLSDSEKTNIKAVKIVPPSLGSNDFGKLKVTFKVPIYEFAHE